MRRAASWNRLSRTFSRRHGDWSGAGERLPEFGLVCDWWRVPRWKHGVGGEATLAGGRVDRAAGSPWRGDVSGAGARSPAFGLVCDWRREPRWKHGVGGEATLTGGRVDRATGRPRRRASVSLGVGHRTDPARRGLGGTYDVMNRSRCVTSGCGRWRLEDVMQGEGIDEGAGSSEGLQAGRRSRPAACRWRGGRDARAASVSSPALRPGGGKGSDSLRPCGPGDARGARGHRSRGPSRSRCRWGRSRGRCWRGWR